MEDILREGPLSPSGGKHGWKPHQLAVRAPKCRVLRLGGNRTWWGPISSQPFHLRWLTSYPAVWSTEQWDRPSLPEHDLPSPGPRTHGPLLSSELLQPPSTRCFLWEVCAEARLSWLTAASHSSFLLSLLCLCSQFTDRGHVDSVCPEAGPGPGWAP